MPDDLVPAADLAQPQPSALPERERGVSEARTALLSEEIELRRHSSASPSAAGAAAGRRSERDIALSARRAP